jgi:hypothetical protein
MVCAAIAFLLSVVVRLDRDVSASLSSRFIFSCMSPYQYITITYDVLSMLRPAHGGFAA